MRRGAAPRRLHPQPEPVPGRAAAAGPGAVSRHPADRPPAAARRQEGAWWWCSVELQYSGVRVFLFQDLHIKDYYGERVVVGRIFGDFDILNNLIWSSDDEI